MIGSLNWEFWLLLDVLVIIGLLYVKEIGRKLTIGCTIVGMIFNILAFEILRLTVL